jgi:N6-adenosine-specific RNA methylase IME4
VNDVAANEAGKYRTIVADPPWKQMGGAGFDGRGHDTRVKRNVGTRTNSRSKPLPYPTMTLPEIAALPVGDLADADAHLYVWVTNRYIEQVYGIARGWGFKPVALLTWCKPPMGRGLGGAFVQTTEHVLFARRGRDIRLDRCETTWWQWSRVYDGRGKPLHSAKPDAFLDKVELVSPEPRIELFARRARFGWDYWGDQSLGTAEMPQPASEPEPVATSGGGL